ncbi:alpha/beta fold hydrolase [Halomicrococcus gelatinilyticus]|uniref:alpha/beta fold hydrolase n=1 Tax=Halomicrococcus gelatinilyticus TaxID=1702103 RepID=UPI002E130E18
MKTVTSDDGTEIAYEQQGDGRPFVLVHPGAMTRHYWGELRPHLTADGELLVPDRRCRAPAATPTTTPRNGR